MSQRRVLVTGANKGIGKATVAAILDHADDTFVFLGSRSRKRGEAARDELVADHPDWADRIEVLELDVGSDESVTAVTEHLREHHGPLYGVVNNAGIGRGNGLENVLNVNIRGPRRVCEACVPLLSEGGRIVNVSSASGPNFVKTCSDARKKTLTSPDVSWGEIEEIMDEALEIERADSGDYQAAGLGDGDPYGLSKACLNAYTISLARRHPELTVNACTPGFIETDMTRPYLEGSDKTAQEMGMKSPAEGTRAQMHLLFGDVGGSGWYFGSDAERSPLDRYRSPGDPPYTGD